MNVDTKMMSPIRAHYEHEKERVATEEIDRQILKIRLKHSSAEGAAAVLKEER